MADEMKENEGCGASASVYIITITGIVQGVGFRPFVHRLARENVLTGWVRNTNTGVMLRLEGRPEGIAGFLRELKEKPPVLAVIEKVEAQEIAEEPSCSAFTILTSERPAPVPTRISPDIATCDDCLRELMVPKDRRYHFPFINCTNCGPRFTIVKETPYDRKFTSMAPFIMCPDCDAEYHDIENRRYHAQPDCCPVCGPALWYVDGETLGTGTSVSFVTEVPVPSVSLFKAQEALLAGKIVAVKGLGGFHLAARADDPAIAQRLRERKERDRRPFAVMCADIAAARELCDITEEEEKLLKSPARPIVLLRKKDPHAYTYLSENTRLGVMLPYTPVHHLLMQGGMRCLIMTSANLSDTPIIFKNEEAMEKLRGIADGFLLHNREIVTRCDDSVMFVFSGDPYFVRRSRGYVPSPLSVPSLVSKERMDGDDPASAVAGILACGAEQKASFAITRGSDVFLSQHIGDLKNIETLTEYEAQIRHFEKLFSLRPAALVCDMHPDYLSTDYAQRRAKAEGLPLIRVQHHHAHMVSCMADNGLEDPVIGIIWDGTGLGTDGTIWGGEFLTGDAAGFTRAGSILPIRLPGGDAAVKEPWRVAISLLEEAGLMELPAANTAICGMKNRLSQTEQCKLPAVQKMLRQNVSCIPSSGMGRLFDGISALLGICVSADYEGEGAVLLEAAAEETEEKYSFIVMPGNIFDWRPMICELLEDLEKGAGAGICAAKFMNTLVEAAARITAGIAEETEIQNVVLSGGVFQNQYLLERLFDRLSGQGLHVYIHHRVSPNDEGICLGQAAAAAACLVR